MLVTSPSTTSRKHYIRANQDIIADVSSIAHKFILYFQEHLSTIGFRLTLDLKITALETIEQLESIRKGASSYIEKYINQINSCFAKPKPVNPEVLERIQETRVVEKVQQEFREDLLAWEDYAVHYYNHLATNLPDSHDDTVATFSKLMKNTGNTAQWLVDFYMQKVHIKYLADDILPAWFEYMVRKHPKLEKILPGITKQISSLRYLLGIRGKSIFKPEMLPNTGVTVAAEQTKSDFEIKKERYGIRRGQSQPDWYIPVI